MNIGRHISIIHAVCGIWETKGGLVYSMAFRMESIFKIRAGDVMAEEEE